MILLPDRPLTPPETEPLDLATVKLWARIDGDAFDALLPGMISAARQVAEANTGSKLITQTWRVELDSFACLTGQRIDLFPVQAVSVSAWNGSAFAAVAGARYRRDDFGIQLLAPGGSPWPAVPTGASSAPVRIDVTCGYGDAAEDVPNAIRQYMAAHVAYWIRQPEAGTARWADVKSPFLDALLDPFKTWA